MDSSISGSNAFGSRRRAFAMFTILTAQFMLAMDLLIVVVALPRIQQDLGFNPAALSWVLNAFGLTFGGLLLLGGRLGDMVMSEDFALDSSLSWLRCWAGLPPVKPCFLLRACCREWELPWRDPAYWLW